MNLTVTEKLEDIYVAAVRASGREPGAGALDPFGKIMKGERERLIRLAERASRDGTFIDRYYRAKLNRAMLNYLDEIEATYSIQLNFNSWGTDLQLSLSCDNLAEVVPLLRILCAEGLRILDRPAPGGASTTKLWRLFPREADQQRDEEGNNMPQLTLYVSAKHCKQVQTGVKEVPIYETVCEWGEAPEEPEALLGEESTATVEELPF